jgi:hypothetical protein
MNITSPDDEITGSEDLISLADVRARLAVLKPFHVEDTRTHADLGAHASQDSAHDWISEQDDETWPDLEVVSYDEELDEQDELRQLEAELTAMGTDNAVAIRASAWPDMARDDAEGMYGADALAGLDAYIDWDRYQADQATDMTEIKFRGTDYYVSPR